MVTIKQAVEKFLRNDEVAYEAMLDGILDKTAFAKKIQKQVEEKTFKKVSVNTIVVSLSRIISKPRQFLSLKPHVDISSIEFKSPIYDAAFEKNPDLVKRVASLDLEQFVKNDEYLALMQGTSNISIICSQDFKEKILAHLQQEPLYEFDNLTAMIIKSPLSIVETPMTTYSLLSKFAVKQINIAEVLPIGTENIILFPPKYMQDVIDSFKDYFGAKE